MTVTFSAYSYANSYKNKLNNPTISKINNIHFGKTFVKNISIIPHILYIDAENAHASGAIRAAQNGQFNISFLSNQEAFEQLTAGTLNLDKYDWVITNYGGYGDPINGHNADSGFEFAQKITHDHNFNKQQIVVVSSDSKYKKSVENAGFTFADKYDWLTARDFNKSMENLIKPSWIRKGLSLIYRLVTGQINIKPISLANSVRNS